MIYSSNQPIKEEWVRWLNIIYSDKNPILILIPIWGGGDVKTTQFSPVSDGYNASKVSRLTICNCGTTTDYSSFGELSAADKLQDYKKYNKIRKATLFVFKWTPVEEKTENMDKILFAAFIYNMDRVLADHGDIREQIHCDWNSIQQGIKGEDVSQAGQKCIHIHKHASAGGEYRALGFTNKFLTWLVAHYTGYGEPTKKGNSWYIKREHFN